MNIVLAIAVLVIGLPIAFWKFRDQFGGALIVLVGIYILGDGLLHSRSMKALASSGQVATAEPVGDSYTEITKRRSGNKSFKAAISFQTAAGQVISETADIPEATLDLFKKGQKVTVTYLPSKPSLYRFNPIPSANNDGILFGLGIVVAGFLVIGYKRLVGAPSAKPLRE